MNRQLSMFDGTHALAKPTAPYAKGSETSKAAAESQTEFKMRADHARILNFLGGCSDGATDQEMQLSIPIDPNTQRPRRKELEAANLIQRADKTRPTKSGKQAVVWILKERYRDA